MYLCGTKRGVLRIQARMDGHRDSIVIALLGKEGGGGRTVMGSDVYAPS